ncbi:MATE family efflux transporter [Actinoplanes cyaneus]|uniref:MATE family efflux transporter n=1 Tax=Actinoplanes cyaneus TaxID=52696 RepID=A0A919IVX8_9ACTN|nr:MATE family efflux transporter [Actinoplanes cyaneus]MCW2144046.1 putative efflux protein, MATE family [Actinoplanes cyaneus]GID70738.1 MATE family efflux transporter [Actinoplanes cyaneus]
MTAAERKPLSTASPGIVRTALDRRFVAMLAVTAVPVAIQALLSSTRGVVDSFLVSQLGTDEVAAVGYSSRVLLVVMLAAMGMADGGAVLIAQFWGSGDVAKARQATALTMLVAVGLGAVACTVCFLFARQIASIGTSDPHVVELGTRYVRVVIWMVLPFGVISALAGSLRSLGEARIGMRFTFVGLAVHIALAWALIFGNAGLPRLGITGAAWSTLISTIVEAGLFAAWVWSKRHPMAFTVADVGDGLRAGLLTVIRRVGVPVSISSVSWAIGTLVFAALVGRAGTLELAVLSIVIAIEGIAIAFVNGIATATGVIVGNGLGRDEPAEETWRTTKALLLWSTGAAVVLGLGLMATRPFIDDIYGGVDPASLAVAKDAVVIVGALFVFRSLAITLQNGLLRAGGDTVYIVFADLGCQWLVAVPLIALTALVWHLPFGVILLAIYSEEIVKTVISGHRVYRRRWMRRVVEEVS